MQIDLSTKLKTVKGKDFEGAEDILGLMLANFLVGNNPAGIKPIKAWQWALKLNETYTLEIDDTDKELLLSAIENDAQMLNILKAQLMLALKA